MILQEISQKADILEFSFCLIKCGGECGSDVICECKDIMDLSSYMFPGPGIANA
jgi:hypothetical protein